jgi:hypothetical protein
MLPLLIASAIAAAGILQYAIFRLLVARRRPVRLERGRAGRIASLASQKRPPVRASARPRNVGHPPPVPTFFPDLDQETPSLEEGIRQLVQSMESVAA